MCGGGATEREKKYIMCRGGATEREKKYIMCGGGATEREKKYFFRNMLNFPRKSEIAYFQREVTLQYEHSVLDLS